MSVQQQYERQPSQYRKLESSSVGYEAPRGCTNIPFLILFFIFWGAFTALAVVAFKQGDLNRLIYGTDYLGNVCGHGTPINVSASVSDNWEARKYLFYPIAFDPFTARFNIRDSLKLGVCVTVCPASRGAPVERYGPILSEDLAPAWWYQGLFETYPKFNRCVPRFWTYDCKDQPNPKECEANRNATGTVRLFDQLMDVQSVAMRGFTELKENWWIVLACCGIAIIISFLWLLILRRLVKPVVVITMVLVFLLLVVIGYFFFHCKQQVEKRDPDSDSIKWYLALAIIMWILAFIYTCVVIFLCKDIMVACDIIEEASKIPIQMPTMTLVPPVLGLWVLPFIFFAVFMAANIYTSASVLSVNVPIVKFSPANGSTIYNTTSIIPTRQYQVENWRTYAHIANVFMFLWSVGLIHAIGYMTIAFCAVFWYWSHPGDEKETDHGVLAALGLTFKNHLGTLCLGSLIIAIIQTIRFCILVFEKRFEALQKRTDAIKFLVYCANCCLAYLERFVKFINKNAYIVTCMTGESFLSAAKHALELLMHNALSVGAVTIIGEYVMIVGKILITVAVTACCYGICTGTDRGSQAVGDSTAGFVLVMITVAILAYFIACIFLNVFGVCIDVVLLSYCYDLEANNGQDKPFFFPEDLAKHVERARDRMVKKQQDMRQSDYEKPLKSA